MRTVFETRTGSPENAGTLASRKTRATHPPRALPAKSPVTSALVARPLGTKVMETLPLPCVPSRLAHELCAEAAAVERAAEAASLSKGGPLAGSSAAVGGGAAAGSAGFDGWAAATGAGAGAGAGFVAVVAGAAAAGFAAGAGKPSVF